jgi:hypothetical protein
MWTKRNDPAPKSECADFFGSVYVQKGQAALKFKFDHFVAFFCLHLLFPDITFI